MMSVCYNTELVSKSSTEVETARADGNSPKVDSTTDPAGISKPGEKPEKSPQS